MKPAPPRTPEAIRKAEQSASSALASDASSAPTAPVDVQWKCQVVKSSEPDLTVGARFDLECGGASASLNKDGLSLELPKAAKYALRLLETKEFTDTHATFVATSHVAGQIKLPNPILTDGKIRVGLGEIQLDVVSVVKQEEGQEPKPYPPWQAETMGLPLFVWVFVGVLIAVAAWGVFMAVRQNLARKRLLKELETHGTALSPYNQFNKELRALTRHYPMGNNVAWSPELALQYCKELNQSFRWFLSRELIVPAFDFKPQKVVKELKKTDRALYRAVGKELRLALREIDKALSASGKVSADDAQQLTDLCRKLADAISKSMAAARQSGSTDASAHPKRRAP
jgi:hypothetical protein